MAKPRVMGSIVVVLIARTRVKVVAELTITSNNDTISIGIPNPNAMWLVNDTRRRWRLINGVGSWVGEEKRVKNGSKFGPSSPRRQSTLRGIKYKSGLLASRCCCSLYARRSDGVSGMVSEAAFRVESGVIVNGFSIVNVTDVNACRR